MELYSAAFFMTEKFVTSEEFFVTIVLKVNFMI